MIVVTGATGHIGNVLVRRLIARGKKVRAVVPPGEDTRPLADLPVEIVRADVRDAEQTAAAIAGAETVYHLAGIIAIASGRERLLAEVNVGGTKNVLRACRATGVGRLVYTSSVHALVEPPAGSFLDEEAPVDPARVRGPYARSKARATLAVREAIEKGLDAVIVFPSGVIGPYDYHLSEMGGLILDYLRRRIKFFMDGAYDFVDVRDVVEGMMAAGEKGRRGEGYLLTGEVITVRGLMELLHALTGIRPPSFWVPGWLAKTVAFFSPLYYALAGKKPRLTSYALHVLGSNCRMTSLKARRELGYSPRPLAASVADTIRWFVEMGWAPRPPVFSG